MVNGRASNPARSLRAKCQTQFVCGVSADSFAPALANSNPRRATVRKLAALTISPREPRSGEFAFPPTSRAKTVERRGRMDCNGDIQAWQTVNSRAM